MISKLIVMSREQCCSWHPSQAYALIQILGLEEGDFPMPPGSLETLQLRFDDVHEGTHRLLFPAGVHTWPAMNSLTAEHEFIAGHSDTVLLPGIEHAREIINFVHNVQQNPVQMDLAVHCLGGVSRSVAVAQFLAGKMNVPLERRSRMWAGEVNPRVTRLLEHAWKEHYQKNPKP